MTQIYYARHKPTGKIVTFDPDFMTHHSEFELLRGIPPEVQANAAALSASTQSRTTPHRPADTYSQVSPAPSTPPASTAPRAPGQRADDHVSFEAFADGAQTIAGQRPENINVKMAGGEADRIPPTPPSTPPAVPLGSDATASAPRLAPAQPPMQLAAPATPSIPPAPPVAARPVPPAPPAAPVPPAPPITPTGAQAITSSLPTANSVAGVQPPATQAISATPPPERASAPG